MVFIWFSQFLPRKWLSSFLEMNGQMLWRYQGWLFDRLKGTFDVVINRVVNKLFFICQFQCGLKKVFFQFSRGWALIVMMSGLVKEMAVMYT